MYLHCDNNVASLRHAVHQLENCIFDICDWMRRNALKLNEDKTEFVIFSTKNNLRDNHLVVGKDKIEESDNVKILGVTFDNNQHLSVSQHAHQEDKQHQTIPLKHCCENFSTIDCYCSSRLL